MDKLGQDIAVKLLAENTLTISLFSGAFKPPTRSHFKIVENAAKISDQVQVIISNHLREGYSPELSLKIWKQYSKLLPENVSFQIATNPSPITEIYSIIKEKSNNYIVLYGKNDKDRFNSINENREKYSNVEVVDVGQLGDVSATKLREAISKRNKLAIKSLIPEGIKVNDFLINFQLHEIKVNNPQLPSDQEIINITTKKSMNDLPYILGQFDFKFREETFSGFLNRLSIIEKNKYYKQLIKLPDIIDEIKVNKPTMFSRTLNWNYYVKDKNVWNKISKQLEKEGWKWLSGKEISSFYEPTFPSIISHNPEHYPHQISNNWWGSEATYFAQRSTKIMNKEDVPALQEVTDKIPGGLAKGKTLQDIADKHKLPLSQLEKSLQQGIKVEMEHTTSEAIAREIAMDHLWEDPKYYDKLSSIEEIKVNNPTHKTFQDVFDLRLNIIKTTREKGTGAYLIVINAIDDILDKYGDTFNFNSTKKFLMSLSGSELTKLYDELKPLLKLNEIKVNKPIKFWKFDTELKVGDRVRVPDKFMKDDIFVYLGGDILKDEATEHTYSIKSMKKMYELDLEQIKNKTQTQNIDESKNLGDLYHFTDLINLDKILGSNYLRPSSISTQDHQRDFQSISKERRKKLQDKGEKYLYYISLSRDKLLYKKNPKLSTQPLTRIQFNGNKLSTNYKFTPFNYYSDDIDSEQERFNSNEGEERIILPNGKGIPNINSYIIDISIILDKIEDNETYLKQTESLLVKYPTLIKTIYKEKPITLEDYKKNILPNIEPYRDEEYLEEGKKSIQKVLGEIKVNKPGINFPIVLTNQEKAIAVGKELNRLDYYWLNDQKPDWTNAPFKTNNFETFRIFLVNKNENIIDYEYIGEVLNESIQINPKQYIKLLNTLVEDCCKELEIQKPVIKLINNDKYTKSHSSYGGYFPQTGEIKLVIYGRLLKDSCVTLAHECYHHYQNENGLLKHDSGKDGDDVENSANSFSGRFLRQFGRQHPEIYFMRYDKN